MKRVTGIGGIFFTCDDPQQQKEWYQKHLHIPMEEWGSVLRWRDMDDPEKKCTTAWSTFKKDTPYFSPGDKSFMINYRVENLEELLNSLRAEGIQVVGDVQEYDYGKFGWIMDPEGNKIELWEPKDEKL